MIAAISVSGGPGARGGPAKAAGNGLAGKRRWRILGKNAKSIAESAGIMYNQGKR